MKLGQNNSVPVPGWVRRKQKKRAAKRPPLLKVDRPHVGGLYHLSWAYHGCVWRLVALCADGINCDLKTPKTGRILRAKVDDLRHTRNNERNPH